MSKIDINKDLMGLCKHFFKTPHSKYTSICNDIFYDKEANKYVITDGIKLLTLSATQYDMRSAFEATKNNIIDHEIINKFNNVCDIYIESSGATTDDIIAKTREKEPLTICKRQLDYHYIDYKSVLDKTRTEIKLTFNRDNMLKELKNLVKLIKEANKLKKLKNEAVVNLDKVSVTVCYDLEVGVEPKIRCYLTVSKVQGTEITYDEIDVYTQLNIDSKIDPFAVNFSLIQFINILELFAKTNKPQKTLVLNCGKSYYDLIKINPLDDFDYNCVWLAPMRDVKNVK